MTLPQNDWQGVTKADERPLVSTVMTPVGDTDLKMAWSVLTKKRTLYNILFSYYDGDQPLKFSTKRLQDAFKQSGVYFCQNWCAVIVDAVKDKLTLKGFDVTEKAADTAIDDLWRTLHLQLEAEDVHEAALVTGEAYMLVGTDQDGAPEAYFNDPRMCHVFYDGDHPNQKRFAVKAWRENADQMRLNLYYTDHVEHYVANSKGWPTSAGAFQPTADTPREIVTDGTIPVFHFRNGKRGGKLELDISIRSMQDAVNKLYSDMLVSAEFTAVRQRVIISQADPGNLKTFQNWWLPAGDGVGQQTSVQELGGADLSNFMKAISDTATAMAVISRTPRHYFYLQGGDPSGDALIAMEAPLNKKVKARQENYAVTWQEVAAYLLALAGHQVKPSDVTPTWEPVETQQPGTTATTIKTNVDAGIPLVTALRRNGWAKDEIDQMEEDQKAAKAKTSSTAQEVLAALRKAQEQNPNNGASSPNATEPPQAATAQPADAAAA